MGHLPVLTVLDVLVANVLPKYLVVGVDDEDGYTTEAWFERHGPAFDHASTLESEFDYEVEVYDVDHGYAPVWPF